MSVSQQPSTLSLPAVPEAVAPRRADGPPANAQGANGVRTDRTPAPAEGRSLPRRQSPATFLLLQSLGGPSIVVSERQPLHANDRERMRHAVRALRLAADRMEEALDSNRAVEALEAATLGSDAGQVAVTVATLLGHKS